MGNTTWHFAENQFDNCTKQSKKRMNRISSDHDSKLQAESSDPDILVLFNRFNPLRTAYSNSYTASISANAIYKGKTAFFESLEKELSETKIEDWDIQIQVVYKKGTPTYIELLPRGREPFQKGTRDQKIEEVLALGNRLTPHPALAATKMDVDAFGISMKDARNVQQQNEVLVAQTSDLLELQRIISANMMYGDLGILMDKFRDNPTQIERFFDLEAIRQTGAEEEEMREGPIAGGDSLNAFSGGFIDITEFLFANPGITNLAYFTSNTADGVYAGVGVEVAPGTSVTKKAIEIGDSGNTFLNVTNLDPDNQGNYSITML